MRTPILLSLLLAASAHAAISQSTITSPGGFAQVSCYSITNGGLPDAGSDITAYGAPQSTDEHQFSGNGSASASGSYSGAPTFNTANVTANLGSFRFFTEDTTHSFQPFPAAIVNGGWKESFTINHPSLNGQSGFMTFELRARGSEFATGECGSAVLLLAPYKNGTILTTNPYFSPGNSDAVGTSNQYGRWGLAAFGATVSRTVDGNVTFSVPITFGQSFTLGVYAQGIAGLRSSGGFGSTCVGRADFSGDGVTWNGISSIRDASGAVISGATVVSGSGINWTNPYTPPPTCGTSDFNGDGDFGTDQDIEAFFACLAGNCCPTCYPGGSDFNGDGDFGTDQDIESFFRVLGGGPC